MYIACIELNGKQYEGTLDFYVLKEVQKTLEKLNRKLKLHEIFKALADEDMQVISCLILHSLVRKENSIEDINRDYTAIKNDEELIDYFININKFLIDLLDECMPKEEKKEESELEDIPDFSSYDDWDLTYMEYLWTTILKRENFWNITPKNFFEQADIHLKVNGKENKDKIEEI